ncbi:uncharacterized protein UV8b_04020 [Ustilaginoidea virens]|uniref:Uncharacterized protein n=1 Tax=Ustilaginoidea virens TaxID=1159556 RepID=A0A8E5HQP5_USTVR|nr:uncharacterized protein UV8b_04020 [Ustilaginoidea virens]QUC19779.1 hypothetical protein UV8b_04020 [Ustilaginoidea virens]
MERGRIGRAVEKQNGPADRDNGPKRAETDWNRPGSLVGGRSLEPGAWGPAPAASCPETRDQTRGQMPDAAGQMPQARCRRPDAAGQMPQATSHKAETSKRRKEAGRYRIERGKERPIVDQPSNGAGTRQEQRETSGVNPLRTGVRRWTGFGAGDMGKLDAWCHLDLEGGKILDIVHTPYCKDETAVSTATAGGSGLRGMRNARVPRGNPQERRYQGRQNPADGRCRAVHVILRRRRPRAASAKDLEIDSVDACKGEESAARLGPLGEASARRPPLLGEAATARDLTRGRTRPSWAT